MSDLSAVEHPALRHDEAARLAALARYGILDTPAEAGFDDIVHLAAEICATPVALVSFIDGGRQWFKARVGFDDGETPIAHSVCAHALQQPGLLVIPDLSLDPRTRENVLVSGEPHIRFYAGARLETPDGVALGTLCVVDGKPRPEGLTPSQADALARLARQVMAQMELRRALAARDEAERRRRDIDTRHRQILDSTTNFAIFATDLEGRVIEWNTGAERILGWSAEEMRGQTAERIFTPEDRAADRPAEEMRLSLEEGRADDERWHLRRDGTRFWASGEMMPLRSERSRHRGFVKILRDRTKSHEIRLALREAEARLRESEDHFRHTVELNPQVPWTSDPAGNITSYSQRWLDLTGQAPGEPDGSGWIKVLHPDDVEPTLAVFSASLASGEPVDVNYRIRVAASGAYRWMRARAYPRRDEASGAILRWYGVVEDVHDRRLAEERLRASEERYRGLFEAIEAGFCIVEMKFDAARRPIDYRIEEANPAFERQTGLGRAQGRWIGEMVPELERHWFDTYGRVALTGEPARFENGASALDGRWFDVFAFRIGAPEAHRVAILFNDISERRRSELALRESEEQFRAFAQAVPNHVWAGTPDGQLYWFNEQVYAYSGAKPGDLDGSAWTRIVHPEDVEPAARIWSESLASGRVYETEFRIRRADGAYRWFLVRAEPSRAADGSPARWIGTSTDIHEQRRALAELALLNETLEQRVAERTRERDMVWRTSRDLFVLCGFDGFYRSVNPAWTDALGYTPDELVGTRFDALVYPDDRAATARGFEKLLGGGSIRDFDIRLRARDGSDRWFSWTCIPEGDQFYAAGRDITERRAIEEQLRQAQKMEAVGQLTGGIAHDFNNLLAGISGSLEMMQTRMSQGRLQDVERYMTAAHGATRRAAALTHRLLAFSRRQTLDPKPTDVNRLVAGMQELIQRTGGPAIALEFVAAPGLWPVLVDPPQLESALLNLCINARDAMPEGGRITVETCNRWLDERAARERDLDPGQYLSLCVTDTGTGMSPDVVAKAFDPFFTTKPIGQGTGLGLSMIYGFAKQSGGQVRIYSEVGQGTMVCIYLPRHYGEVEDEDAPPKSVPPRSEQGETVLIVDDEPSVRMLVTDILDDLGYTAIEAGDSAAGLKLLQSDVRIDLLITDVGLPGGMNGRQMADASRAKRPGLKVLFITGYAENAVLGNGQLAPGMQVLTKPFAVEAMAERIRAMIEA